MEQKTAIVTIRRADEMTERQRRTLARWLREQAEFIEKHGDQMAKRFTARYFQRAKRKG